jgi:hypothetical protein
MEASMRKSALLIISSVFIFWTNSAFAKYFKFLPSSIVRGSVDVTEYDGQTLYDGYPDDLLSGGLNAEGLQLSIAPDFADPLNPTPRELRRHAIYTNFRAITDMTTAGGYGLFWGPDLAPDFLGVEQGLIPGNEY